MAFYTEEEYFWEESLGSVPFPEYVINIPTFDAESNLAQQMGNPIRGSLDPDFSVQDMTPSSPCGHSSECRRRDSMQPCARAGHVLATARHQPQKVNTSTSTSTINSRRHKCTQEHCTKAFERKTDLNRHILAIHTPKDQRDYIVCDYSDCKRVFNPMTRDDHYRNHLRSDHKEDLPKRRKPEQTESEHTKETQQILNASITDPHCWRCSRCLVIVPIDAYGWTCPKCKRHIGQPRLELRMRRAATAATAATAGAVVLSTALEPTPLAVASSTDDGEPHVIVIED